MRTRRIILLLGILLATALPGHAAEPQLQQFATSHVTIVSADGPHRFMVELAETPGQMEQGLMFRHSLAPDAGMLFDFGSPTNVTMWMKNTLIPLDMLFLDSSGRIIDIHERAVPRSLETIAAKAPSRYVIELNGGTVERLGIKPGDRATSPYVGQGS